MGKVAVREVLERIDCKSKTVQEFVDLVERLVRKNVFVREALEGLDDIKLL